MPIISGSAAPVQSASVTLTNAQIIALPTTPIQIVAAQGVGTIIVPIMGVYAARTTVAYTNLAKNIVLALDAANNFNQMTAGALASILLGDANATEIAADPGASLAGTPLVTQIFGQSQFGFDNAALSVAASTNLGNITGGAAGNTLKVTAFYVVAVL